MRRLRVLMADSERFPTDVPGVRIADVLDTLDPVDLAKLVGTDVLDALQAVRGPDAANAAAIEKLLDFETIVTDAAQLRLLLDCLPEHKSRELAERLDTAPDRVQDAVDLDVGPRVIAAFFGVHLDFEELEHPEARRRTASVSYGLFSHQRAACLKVMDLLEDPRDLKPAALLHMPTGAGKTRTAAHIICRHLLAQAKGVVIWFANTRELLEQAASELEQAWHAHGDRDIDIVRFWGSGASLEAVEDGIIVAGLQKTWALVDRDPTELNDVANRATLTVVDEAHISLAPTYRMCINLVRRRPGAGLLGLTATPGRTWNDPATDAELSEMYSGNKVTLEVAGYPEPVEYLMTNGYLATPNFHPIDLEGEPIDLLYDADEIGFDEDYPYQVVRSVAHSARYLSGIVRAIDQLVRDGHRRIIVFAATVSHAEQVASLLRATGTGAEAVTGATPSARRSAAIRRFKTSSDEPRVLVNYGVLTTGFDAPATSAAVIARPTRSLVLYSQMVGRSIRGRKAGGNDTADILTVVDPDLPGFGSVAAAFKNWEDVW